MTDAPAPPEGPPDEAPVIRAIAMPADTNPEGDVFGGWLMSWMDLAASTVAFGLAGGRCATVAADRIAFLAPVLVGDEVSLFARLEHRGRTSMRVAVEGWRRRRDSRQSHRIVTGVFTYVALDEAGHPRPIAAEGSGG